MDRRQALRLAAGAALAGPLTAAAAGRAFALAGTDSPPAQPVLPAPQRPAGGRYNSDDYAVSMSLYCFNSNIQSWLKGRTKGAPPLSTSAAIDWAKSAGFEAVDITAYYIPGYDTHTMPTLPTDQITSFAAGLRGHCEDIGISISGTGAFNDFADPDDARRALDVQRVQFWTDIAAVMGAPVIRVFSGVIPADLDQAGGWEAVTRARIVPALQQVTAYAETKGVKVVLQNHGDMTSTADQTIQMAEWVGNANLSIIDDTGYFRPFGAASGADYDWYRDIAKILPYSESIQVKRLPAGEENPQPLMDYQRLFTGMRLSGWRHFVPLERLWAKDAADNPKSQPTPPYDQVASFLAEVRAGLAATAGDPFQALLVTLMRLGRSRQIGFFAQEEFSVLVANAGRQYEHGKPGPMRELLKVLRAMVARDRPDVSAEAAGQILSQLDALLVAVADVFG